MARRLIVLAASCSALAPRAPVKPTQFFRGRFDGKQFRTEPLEAATFDEFSTDEGAAAPGNPQLFTADGAPLMTAPCCIKVVGVGGGGGNAVNRMVERVAPRPSNSEPAVTHPRTPIGRTRAPSWTFGP